MRRLWALWVGGALTDRLWLFLTAGGGMETPGGVATPMTDLTAVGEGRGTVLGLKLDRLSGAHAPSAAPSAQRIPSHLRPCSLLSPTASVHPARSVPSPCPLRQTPCPGRRRWTRRGTSRTSSP